MSDQEKLNDPAKAPFVSKDAVVVEGLTEDYVWYHADLLERDMNGWQSRFKKLVSVMESRHKEHLRMINGLLDELSELKKELNERS
jgi:hypothetical protein